MSYKHRRKRSKNSKTASINGGYSKSVKSQSHKHHSKPLCLSCGLSSESYIELCHMCYYGGNGNTEDRMRFEEQQEKEDRAAKRNLNKKKLCQAKLNRYDLEERSEWLSDDVVIIDDKFKVTSDTENEYEPKMYVEVIYSEDKKSKKYHMKDFRQFVDVFLNNEKIECNINASFITKKRGISSRKKIVHHIWTGSDTACHMASTGGLDVKKYKASDPSNGGTVCKLCTQTKN